jgi:hypothetical protein
VSRDFFSTDFIHQFTPWEPLLRNIKSFWLSLEKLSKWRCIHPQTNRVVMLNHTVCLPMNRLLWQFVRWHSDTYSISPCYFCPPRVQDGHFVICDISSTLFSMPYYILSNLPLNKMWKFCLITWVFLEMFGLACRGVDIMSQWSMYSKVLYCAPSRVLYSTFCHHTCCR